MIELLKTAVIHKTFGAGKIKEVENGHVVIVFGASDSGEPTEKKFVYPDAFKKFLKINDPAIAEQVDNLIKIKDAEEDKLRELDEQEKREKRVAHIMALEESKKKLPAKTKTKKTNTRQNIAFKLNYCDGGAPEQIGFNGICSDETIRYNIIKEKRVWCSSKECLCSQYLDGDIDRKALDNSLMDDNFDCYESQLLKNWKVMAGEDGDGKTRKIKSARRNSLAVLTTRLPHTKEAERIIFGVFIIDDVLEGNDRESGYVSNQSTDRITLTLEEAKSMQFWNYHANSTGKVSAKWGSGLFRYMDDIQAVALLQDLVKLKQNSPDAQLANDLLESYCRNNLIELSAISQ
ncbi:MAG: hypothetical protein CVV00_14970 [Firmicutes bacterium HGW-Firmicutes-5]|jgi:hypothetical protein|nr:MAG: hypothetical protein CVV00_14970 [Firmicutes bacterium HGW-Firmicutes-5]